jgi:hypothetical protein
MTLRVLPLLYIAASVLLLLGGLPTTNGDDHRNDVTTAATAASGDDVGSIHAVVVVRGLQATSYRNNTNCVTDSERDFVCDKQIFGNGDVLESCERTYNEKACSNCTLCPLNGGSGFQLDCSNIVNKTVLPLPDQCLAFASPTSSGVSIWLGASTSTFLAMAATLSVLGFGGFFAPY